MSDTLENIYPIPVEFVEGQQPTAAFFNAWAAQVDSAFSLISNILGDFDGTGESPDTFVPNVMRALGNQGLLTNRLPAGLRIAAGGGPGDNLPIIEESLAAWEGMREALLTFTPAVSEANNADFEASNLGTRVAKGSPIAASVLNSLSDRVILDGRRIITNFPIPANARVHYPIDTSSQTFSENMGEGTGPNLVPSIFEIIGDDPVAVMVRISQPNGYAPNEYRLTFPSVSRVMNPYTYSSYDSADQLVLDSVTSPVKWNTEGQRTTPKYAVPQWIMDLPGSIIPRGLASLWYRSGPTIIRVRNIFSTEDIAFEIIDSYRLKITVPEGLDLPAAPETAGESSYIVGFAGTSTAQAMIHERAFAIRHAHDGVDGNLVSAEFLTDRFNPEGFATSGISHNHFPQYLERGGYQNDLRNGSNVMLGDLVVGSVLGTPTPGTHVGLDLPTSPILANSLTTDSHKLKFSHGSTGPNLWHNASDTIGTDAQPAPLRKVTTDNGFRAGGGGVWLGTEGADNSSSIWTDNDGAIVIVTVGLEDGDPSSTYLRSGDFVTWRGGIIFAPSEVSYNKTNSPLIQYGLIEDSFPHSWNFRHGNAITETQIRVGKIQADTVLAENIGTSSAVVTSTSVNTDAIATEYIAFEDARIYGSREIIVDIPMGEWVIINGLISSPFNTTSAFDSNIDTNDDLPLDSLIFPRNPGGISSLQVMAEIPNSPWKTPISLASDYSMAIKEVEFAIAVARSAGADDSEITYGARIVRQLLNGREHVISASDYETANDTIFPGAGGVYMDHIISVEPGAPIVTISTGPQSIYKYCAVLGLFPASNSRNERLYLKRIRVTYELSLNP